MPPVESGLLRFVPPIEFPACATATLGDAGGDSISEPTKICSKLHVRWVRASANQLTRVLVDSDGGMPHLANYVDEVLENCEVRWAPDKAPHVPIAGTCAVSMFTQKAQVDLPFLGDLTALRAMDVFPKYSPLPPAPPKNPQEVRGDFCGGRLGTSGPPKCIQMDEGGERKNEIWTDLRVGRGIKLQFQGIGDHPCLLERRNGLARGIYNRLLKMIGLRIRRFFRRRNGA